jgi:hypothetical protein
MGGDHDAGLACTTEFDLPAMDAGANTIEGDAIGP